MANESELRKQMEAAYPVSQWSRTTAADGKWLNKNTIKPLNDRDDFLADAIDGFDAKIKAEADARAAADTAIEQSFANEATERASKDTEITTAISNESTAREAADSALQERLGDLNDDLKDHKELDAASDEFGHLTNTDYVKFNNGATTVENNKDNWDNISTITVGTTSITGNNVTITGTNNIDVTADSSTKTITVKTTGSVGDSTTPIYMKEDGTFAACAGGSSNNFGNAIISIGGDTATNPGHNYGNCIYFVNNSTQKTCTIPKNTIEDWQAALRTMLTAGVNNFVIRFDGDSETKPGWMRNHPKKNRIEIRWPADAMDLYKMYTINFVPLAQPGEPAPDTITENVAEESDCLIVIDGGDDPIKYMNDQYSWQTYAYYYNVPAFIPVKLPENKCTPSTDPNTITHSWGAITPFTSNNGTVQDRKNSIKYYKDSDEFEFSAYDSNNKYVTKFTFTWEINNTSHELNSHKFYSDMAGTQEFAKNGVLYPSDDQKLAARDSFYMNPTWKIDSTNYSTYGYKDPDFEEISMRCIQEHRAVTHEWIGKVYLDNYTDSETNTTYYSLPTDVYGHLGDKYAYIIPLQGDRRYGTNTNPVTNVTTTYNISRWNITRRQMSFMRGADIVKNEGDKDGSNTVVTGGTAKTIYFFTQATY